MSIWLMKLLSNISEYIYSYQCNKDDIEAQKRNKEMAEIRKKLWEQGLYDLEEGEIIQ